jgi:hypothetical protein
MAAQQRRSPSPVDLQCSCIVGVREFEKIANSRFRRSGARRSRIGGTERPSSALYAPREAATDTGLRADPSIPRKAHAGRCPSSAGSDVGNRGLVIPIRSRPTSYCYDNSRRRSSQENLRRFRSSPPRDLHGVGAPRSIPDGAKRLSGIRNPTSNAAGRALLDGMRTEADCPLVRGEFSGCATGRARRIHVESHPVRVITMVVSTVGRRGGENRGRRPRPVDDRSPPAFLLVGGQR